VLSYLRALISELSSIKLSQYDPHAELPPCKTFRMKQKCFITVTVFSLPILMGLNIVLISNINFYVN
jgi:hypothetical protein